MGAVSSVLAPVSSRLAPVAPAGSSESQASGLRLPLVPFGPSGPLGVSRLASGALVSGFLQSGFRLSSVARIRKRCAFDRLPASVVCFSSKLAFGSASSLRLLLPRLLPQRFTSDLLLVHQLDRQYGSRPCARKCKSFHLCGLRGHFRKAPPRILQTSGIARKIRPFRDKSAFARKQKSRRQTASSLPSALIQDLTSTEAAREPSTPAASRSAGSPVTPGRSGTEPQLPARHGSAADRRSRRPSGELERPAP
jgi:hypothetical protein